MSLRVARRRHCTYPFHVFPRWFKGSMLVIKEGLTREGILCEPSRVIKAIQRGPSRHSGQYNSDFGGEFSKARVKTTTRFLDVSFFSIFFQLKKSHEYKENHFYDTFLEEISFLAIGICMWRELFRFEISGLKWFIQFYKFWGSDWSGIGEWLV